MSNVAGKAYIMNVVTPMRPWLTWIQRLSYMTGRAIGPFCPLGNYQAQSIARPWPGKLGVDGAWISSTKFPHSIPSTRFKDYIRVNQIDADYYYNATPGAEQRDFKAALRVRRAILAMAKQ